MVEPFLPWWLVLLLGMWATTLAVWQHPSVHREVRLWAGLLTLVYSGLIFLALGFIPRLIGAGTSFLANLRIVDLGQLVCAAISLTCGSWMLGRISLRCCHICYIAMTFSNAVFCALVQQMEIAVGLLIVTLLSARQPVLEWFRSRSRSPRLWLGEFIRFADEPVPLERTGEPWLIGGMNFMLACVFIGSLAFALRVETARTIQSSRQSAIPSRDQLDRIHSGTNAAVKEQAWFDLAFGQRADVVVLLAAILFISLAVVLNDARPPKPLLASSEHDRPSENSP